MPPGVRPVKKTGSRAWALNRGSEVGMGPSQLPAYTFPKDLGQTSRAYALTHGAQKDLVPRQFNFSDLAGISGVENRGGSLPVGPAEPGFIPQEADLSRNPYGTAYDKLIQFVKDSAAARAGDYAATKTAFQNQQAASNKDMYQSYLDSRLQSDASSNALGVDPNAVSANRDLSMRKIQENSDQSLADNLAWLDKLGLLRQDMLSSTGNAIAGEKTVKMAGWDAAEQQRVADLNLLTLQKLIEEKLAGSRSGGGGRRGGGSSSSGSIKETATITDTLNDSGMDLEQYLRLQANNPDAAELFKNATNLSGTDVSRTSLLQKGVNENTASANSYKGNNSPLPFSSASKFSRLVAQRKAEEARRQAALYQIALEASMNIGGTFGNNRSQTVIRTVGSQRRG